MTRFVQYPLPSPRYVIQRKSLNIQTTNDLVEPLLTLDSKDSVRDTDFIKKKNIKSLADLKKQMKVHENDRRFMKRKKKCDVLVYDNSFEDLTIPYYQGTDRNNTEKESQQSIDNEKLISESKTEENDEDSDKKEEISPWKSEEPEIFLTENQKTEEIKEKTDDDTLIFESRFESANLEKAFRVFEDKHEYDLKLQNDSHTQGHTQWFFFIYYLVLAKPAKSSLLFP